MQNGPSAKRISETSMQMKQAETARDFKPSRSFRWAEKIDFIIYGGFIYCWYRIERENSMMRKINCVLTNQIRG